MIEDQPAPVGGSGDIWLQVIEDMKARREIGIARYGTPLKKFDGRNTIVDAYQEALDQCVYLRKYLSEHNIQFDLEQFDLNKIDVDTFLFPEAEPLLKTIGSLNEETRRLMSVLYEERKKRMLTERIAKRVIALVNKRVVALGVPVDEYTTFDNIEKHLHMFETALHKLFLGVTP